MYQKPYILVLILFSFLFTLSGYSQRIEKSVQEPVGLIAIKVVDTLYSPSLEGNLLGDPTTQHLTVILPPGYELYPKNKYPVVYFLHGYTQNYNTYANDFLAKLRYMITNRIIAPMILVMPNSHNKFNGSYYTNSYVSGNWEDYIVQDVRQYIENNYNTLNQRESRGLSGHSMGGYGTWLIGMKHPSIYGSIAPICAATLDLEVALNSEDYKPYFISAAEANEYRSNQIWQVRDVFAEGVAFAPDSTVIALCRLPFDKDGNRIDSTWQQWIKHTPAVMLPDYTDSLLKLNNIQIYIGDSDNLTFKENESFHQALLDQGIIHGYEIYEAGHNPVPAMDDALIFFSDQLTSIVPIVNQVSNEFLLSTDHLVVESDRDGKVYMVPASAGPTYDSIFECQVFTSDVVAGMQYEYKLSEYDYGKYYVFSVSNDSMISVPAEFAVVPDTTPPVVILVKDTVLTGDSIAVSMNRDGTVYLMSTFWGAIETFQSESEIIDSPDLIEQFDIVADEIVGFTYNDLDPHQWPYAIVGVDEYGIISVPQKVQVIPVSINTNELPKIEFYPNPTTGIMTLQITKSSIYFVEIASLNGQLLFTGEMEGPTHQLDLSSFQKGVYFITIRSKDFVTTRKVVKLE